MTRQLTKNPPYCNSGSLDTSLPTQPFSLIKTNVWLSLQREKPSTWLIWPRLQLQIPAKWRFGPELRMLTTTKSCLRSWLTSWRPLSKANPKSEPSSRILSRESLLMSGKKSQALRTWNSKTQHFSSRKASSWRTQRSSAVSKWPRKRLWWWWSLSPMIWWFLLTKKWKQPMLIFPKSLTRKSIPISGSPRQAWVRSCCCPTKTLIPSKSTGAIRLSCKVVANMTWSQAHCRWKNLLLEMVLLLPHWGCVTKTTVQMWAGPFWLIPIQRWNPITISCWSCKSTLLKTCWRVVRWQRMYTPERSSFLSQRNPNW